MADCLRTGGWLWGLAVLLAVGDWVAVIAERKRMEYVFKPATMVALLVIAWRLSTSVPRPALAVAFILGLGFSLLGDVALMLPGAWGFLPGLAAFLLGHLAYITGFNLTLPPLPAFGILLPVALLDVIVLRRLLAGLEARGDSALRLPVVVYAAVLSLTLASGWSTLLRPAWSAAARAAAIVGGTLFFASDLMLAWDRFVHRSKVLHVLVIITYHLAQFALTCTLGLAP